MRRRIPKIPVRLSVSQTPGGRRVDPDEGFILGKEVLLWVTGCRWC
jgi:hypothetical protein